MLVTRWLLASYALTEIDVVPYGTKSERKIASHVHKNGYKDALCALQSSSFYLLTFLSALPF